MTKQDFYLRYPKAKDAVDIAWTGGQWNGSGVCITASIWQTKDSYYLAFDLTDESRDREFCRENGYDEDAVNRTKDFCERFGFKSLGKGEDYAVELANGYLKDEIGSDVLFIINEYSNIEGL